MTKFRKSIVAALACAMLLALCAFVFAACGGSNYTVVFLVRENGISGEWQEYASVKSSGGAVTLPADPAVEGYVFRDWYTDEDCTEIFDETNVTGNISVYALMAEKIVTLYITDGEGETATVTDFKLAGIAAATEEYAADALSFSLTFDGWYTDSNCTTAYASNMDTIALYGRYMAKVVFDNGYDTLEKLVTPNGTLSQPSLSEIKKDYMSAEDIYYVYADTKADVSFPAVVSVNTSVTVQWKTEGLRFETNTRTGNLICTGFAESSGSDYRNLQIVSVPSRVGGVKVESVSSLALTASSTPAVRKVIFQEGIKSVSNFNGWNTSGVEQVVLPESLRIIDESFNGFPNLKEDGFAIPDKTEIIIGSFFSYKSVGFDDVTCGEYSFDIAVPDSVINLSNVPVNLVFGEKSVFKKDGDGRIYTDNEKGKLLIADGTVTNGAISVPEGYVGIQVGTFLYINGLEYLTLPSTWSYVEYNLSYESLDGDGVERTYYLKMNSAQNGNLSRGDMSAPVNDLSVGAYAIVSNMESIVRIRIQQAEFPAGVEIFALAGNTYEGYGTYYEPYLAAQFRNKVFFMEDLEPGTEVTVRIEATNGMSGAVTETSLTGVVSGDTITPDIVAEAIGAELGVDFAGVYVLLYVRESGVDFGDGFFVTRNLDITAAYEYGAFGYTLADDGSGGLEVVAYDANSVFVSGDEKIVSIPDETGGKPITAIREGAFQGTDITTAYIGKNVAVIGAEAFMNTTSLTAVTITPGGLSVIGRSAFENSGFASIALPLANLTDVQPYAFKSDKLQKFLGVEEEKTALNSDRVLMFAYDYYYAQLNMNYFTFNSVQAGEYFFISDFSGNNVMLAKYTGYGGTEKQGTASDPSEKTVDVQVYDVELVAVAGGASITSLALGYSSRGIYFGAETGFVCRFSIAEGSVYYLDSLTELNFGYVSAVAENAFTDMGENLQAVVHAASYYAPGRYAADCYDEWMNVEQITTMDEAIFADGWWNGVKKSDADYAEKLAFMTNATQSAATNVAMICH